MSKHTLVWLMAFAFLATAHVLADDAKKDQDLIQGTWLMDSAENDMGKAPPEVVKSYKRTFKADEATLLQNGMVITKGTFKLDSGKKPKTIDLTFSEGEAKGKTMLGIYELEGDTLKICFAPSGEDRPTEFAVKPGTKRAFATWKREKK